MTDSRQTGKFIFCACVALDRQKHGHTKGCDLKLDLYACIATVCGGNLRPAVHIDTSFAAGCRVMYDFLVIYMLRFTVSIGNFGKLLYGDAELR